MKWPKLYAHFQNEILDSIGNYIQRIEHIGSTAIANLAAKPTIDILIGLHSLRMATKCIPKLQGLGFEYRSHFEDVMPFRRYFVKTRDNKEDEHLIHIHMIETNHEFFERHILFRDYLRKHESARDEYAELKKQLADKFVNKREEYVEGKSDFIKKIERLAKKSQRENQ